MKHLLLSELATIVKGQLFVAQESDDVVISEVVTDSRTFFKKDGAVFFALIGPTNNGHNYVAQLIRKGIAALVVSDRSVITKKAAFILVDDTQSALQKLAAYSRKQFSYPVVAITGSNGKTIVKEWLHDILSASCKIVRSPKSYNSQVGVPLSVLLMNNSYNLGIFEAGISQNNEMQNLADIILPELGILTNIGDAHQKNFQSVQQKLKEKLLLFKHCNRLVFRTDDKQIATETSSFCRQNSIEQFCWSLEGKDAQLQFEVQTHTNYSEISARYLGKKYVFSIPFTDNSSVENACHCFSCILALDKNPKEFCVQFEHLQTVAMRLEIKQGINNCLLINDYYNSDLNSLSIALSVVKQQAAKEHLHKIVILSDIQQSGIPENTLYQKVNKLLEEWHIDEMIGIGATILRQRNAFSMKTSFYKKRSDFENDFKRSNFNASAILIKGARNFEFEKISGLLQQKAHQTVLEINLNALINNLTVFRSLLKPTTKIMVMVKAFSYGSGDVEIARLLQYQNVDYLAVAVADEGVQLRNAGITTPIVVMNPEQESFQNIIDYSLEPNIYSSELLKDFMKAVSSNAYQNFPVHLKIDTGMNRLGLKTEDEIIDVVETIKDCGFLKLKSVFSHLAGSDEPGLDEFTHSQIERFNEYYQLISKYFNYHIDGHILNSSGIERFTSYQYDMVRLGIGLYGISQTGLPLENIGTLKSTVSQVKKVSGSETVGYSRKGKVAGTSKIAIIPLGYADGLDRKMGNRTGNAFINGKYAPIIGNVCMDMLMLDVTGIDVKKGDIAEFFGAHISIDELAQKVGTIPYEILTGISQRVKRVYLQE